VQSRRKVVQRHQILTVLADVRGVVIDGVFLAGYFPVQRTSGERSGYAYAVVDTRFDLCAFFVVIPGHKLQQVELSGRVVRAVHFCKGLQPRLSAFLAHHPVCSPSCQVVIEAFVGGPDRVLLRKSFSSFVKVRQVAHAIVGRGGHHPRITAGSEGVTEAAAILENEQRIRCQRGFCGCPVNFIDEIDVKVGHYWRSVNSQIGGRRKVLCFDILQELNQRLLYAASGAHVLLDRTLVHHNGHIETGMGFGFGHHDLGGLIDRAARAIPINNHAIDAASDHVCDLLLDLRRIRRVVADVHVIGTAEPEHQVGEYLGIGPGVEQGMDVELADIALSQVAVGLAGKAVGCAGVVRSLGR
jgi:hypothetical protein